MRLHASECPLPALTDPVRPVCDRHVDTTGTHAREPALTALNQSGLHPPTVIRRLSLPCDVTRCQNLSPRPSAVVAGKTVPDPSRPIRTICHHNSLYLVNSRNADCVICPFVCEPDKPIYLTILPNRTPAEVSTGQSRQPRFGTFSLMMSAGTGGADQLRLQISHARPDCRSNKARMANSLSGLV